MKISRLAAATAIATIMAAGGASALTLKPTGFSGGSQGISVTSPTKSVNAGGFDVTDTSGVLGSFIAFCLDLEATISFGNTYNYEVTNTPFSNSVDLIANGGIGRIQAIFDANYSTSVATDSSLTSAGFQVALWNAVYDDDWSVTNGDGNFYATSNANVTAKANEYLIAAQNYEGSKFWNLSYLQSTDQPRHQNLVTAAPVPRQETPAPVPLPAAGLLLLGALGGLAAAQRRRTAA